MSLWGNLDNISVAATSRVWLNYSTGIVTATNGNFGQVGYAKTGDVIKFGARATNGTYFGDAVIIGITSANQLSIGRTCGLNGVAIANTSYTINEQPQYLIKDTQYQFASGEFLEAADTFIYGISTAGTQASENTIYEINHSGWVGIRTYTDMHGSLRVKKETIVAMSGIATGNVPNYPGQK
jgi:hypothetical protein